MNCPTCGLNLAGATGDACPRCGMPFSLMRNTGSPDYGSAPQPPQPAPGGPPPGYGQPAGPSRPFADQGMPPNYPMGGPNEGGAYGGQAPYGPPAGGPPPGYGMGQPSGFGAPTVPSRPMGPMMTPPTPVAPPRPAKKSAGSLRVVISSLVGAILLFGVVIGIAVVRNVVSNSDSYALTSVADGWTNTSPCTFKGDGYHISAAEICYAPSNALTSGTISVQVKQISGPPASIFGLVFHRVSKGNYYSFRIDGAGEWAFFRVVNGSAGDPLSKGTSVAINQGLNTTNTLQVQASGSQFTLFV
ncbi:MAG: hypothetical protein IVW57_14925, partial [Ktedonobacterales bacterium]|nr:hypothetical protein [Ktedonobacterales bacterium]